jgi:hypothetical protein
VSEIIETPNFKEMDIGTLRKYASHMRLAIAKTSTKAEIIQAIERKLNGRVVPEFATDESRVKPGYAKIRLLSDPMPDAKNLPVFLNCNGYTCLIPRDVEVIVPMRVVRTLNYAQVTRKKQDLVSDNNGREVMRETSVTVPSYPFQILEMTPGPEVLTNLELSKLKTMGPKRRYRKMFGHWPKPRELTRAIEQKLIKLEDDEQLSPTEEKLLGEVENA